LNGAVQRLKFVRSAIIIFANIELCKIGHFCKFRDSKKLAIFSTSKIQPFSQKTCITRTLCAKEPQDDDGDNGTLFELFAQIDPNDQQEKVGTWVPIHLDALERWRSVNKKNIKNNRHISELADWYVFIKAGCLR
jgi:hypothetical protein